jgi:hypothetical protein
VSAQLVQIDPITAANRLVGQTATDAATQAARVATFPIARALVLNVSRALGGGGAVRAANTEVAALSTPDTPAPPAALAAGGGLLGTVQNVVVDAVDTTVRLVPASIDAAAGVITSAINVPLQTGIATTQAVLNVGAAVLTLNPATVLNAAALGAVRVAGVVEQTTIGTPPLPFNSGQSGTALAVARVARTPSVLTSILNGRDEIANAISPVALRAQSQAVSSSAPTTAASATTAAVAQKSTPTPAAEKVANRAATVSSPAKAADTSVKHAKK